MKIGVVIVTYNRLKKLKIALDCFDKQTRLPDSLIVVDNASSDGTCEWLWDWREKKADYSKTIVSNKENLGGSGGFYEGLKTSLESGCDWIWVSDDDAYPDSCALENTYKFLKEREEQNISAICGKVVTHGEIAYAHRMRYSTKRNKITVENCIDEDYSKNCFELNAFSYVGTVINVKKIKQVGLTERDYFIWLDDTEHSIRLSEVGKIYCVPSILINHDVDEGNEFLSWKDYYGYRNRVDMYSKHFSGTPYVFFIMKRKMKSLWLMMFEKNREYALLYREALNDGMNHNLGKHRVYKPGWKPKSQIKE